MKASKGAVWQRVASEPVVYNAIARMMQIAQEENEAMRRESLLEAQEQRTGQPEQRERQAA